MIRTETSKTEDLGNDQFSLEAKTGPMHYKDTYADHESWLDLDENYSEPGLALDGSPCLVYSKLPNITRVFKDKLGYEIQSRSNPDHIARVELATIDGVSAEKFLATNPDIFAWISVHPNRVGVWKQFKRAQDKECNLKWKITEVGNSDKDTHPFSLRDTPEAFSTVDAIGLTPKAAEAVRIPIATVQERIDDKSRYLTEVIPKQVMLVDTDFQTASNNSMYLVCKVSNWLGYAEYALAYIGYYDSNNANMGDSILFTNVSIPFVATITSAVLKPTAQSLSSNTTVNSRIIGHKVANSTVMSDLADYQARRGTVVAGANDNYITTAYTTWDSIPTFSADTQYTSPSISGIITEIIGISGWAENNALTIFWDDHAGRSTVSNGVCRYYYSYKASASKSPVLTITWTPITAPCIKRMSGVQFARIFDLGRRLW